MSININRVVITGNLTADPELRPVAGTQKCRLRLAVNTRRRAQDGSWEDKPNYFDVVVWGTPGENAARYLKKGRGVAVDGRLEWREWTAQDGTKRQAVEIVAESVQFLSSPNGAERAERAPQASAGAGEFEPATGDEDIPF